MENNLTRTKVINNYIPKCNNNKYSEKIKNIIHIHNIINYTNKKQCTACELAFDTKYTNEKDDIGRRVIKFDHSNRKFGENCGYRMYGQNITNCHILFIDCFPSKIETECGIPFTSNNVGLMIRKNIRRYMKNVDLSVMGFTYLVHCRTINGETPQPTHIKACASILKEDLNIAQPYIIAPIGRAAASFLINDKEENNSRYKSIKEHHGEFMDDAYYRGARVIPVLDPREANDSRRDNEAKSMCIEWRIWNDLRFIEEQYQEIVLSGKSNRMEKEIKLEW